MGAGTPAPLEERGKPRQQQQGRGGGGGREEAAAAAQAELFLPASLPQHSPLSLVREPWPEMHFVRSRDNSAPQTGELAL